MRILTLLSVFATVSSSGFERVWKAFFVPNLHGSPTPHADQEQEMDHWAMFAQSTTTTTSTITTQAPPITSTTNMMQSSFRRERFWSEALRDGPPGPIVSKLAPMRLAESVIESMSPTIRGLVQEQCALDDKETDSCPLIHYMDEFPRINGVHERLVLGRLIARQQFSTLFQAVSSSGGKYVIKYQCDCDDVTDLHPLLRDYWFLKALNQTDIAIKVHYLSPPVRWTGPLTAKTQFSMSDTEKRECMKNGSIRYLIMSQGMASMYQIVQKAYKGPIGFVDAINVMELLIEKIQRMHGLGIIHGDIHPGNVLLMGKGDWQIGLIDFGSAMFVDELASQPAQIRSPGSYVHSLFSHWNVEGYRFSYRDDVFKALYVGAYLMNGDRYTDYVRTLERSATAMIHFKKFSFMFTYPGGRDILSGIAVGDRRPDILSHLDRALHIARSVDEIDGIPDYAGILTELGHASRIAMVEL